MTGTSIDGLDLAAIRLEPEYTLVASGEYQIPATLKSLIVELARSSELTWQTLGRADALLGEFIGDTVNAFLAEHNINPAAVAAIGSHGQTVHHSPNSNPPFTVQIGDPSRISERTGLTVVNDFRRADIAFGGQGAPLVPLFHKELFARQDSTVAVCNIGGIANLTILFGGASREILGFDTGPGNTLLDAWCNQHTGAQMDRDGAWATRGSCNHLLLSALLGDAFVQQPPPKSTGVEHYNLPWLDTIVARQKLQAIEPEDVQATLLMFTARSIAAQLRAVAPDCTQLILCGGGRHNTALTNLLADQTHCQVVNCDELGVDGDSLEACAFAWLASRSLAELPGNAPSVTGARKAVRLGTVTRTS